MTADRIVRVDSVAPEDDVSVELIARRMRLTLVEVLDEERADAMFEHDGLVERVRWHLDRVTPDRQAEVFMASVDGEMVGHTMVRVDVVDGEELGLFATIYVTPPARRWGVASALVQAGEAWMVERKVVVAATYTDAHNERLLAFFRDHKYECTRVDDEWATARRSLV